MVGQQQLLLLVAAIVVVGFAAIYGIYTFTETASHAEASLLVHDGAGIVIDTQAPEPLPADAHDSAHEAVDESTEDQDLSDLPVR